MDQFIVTSLYLSLLGGTEVINLHLHTIQPKKSWTNFVEDCQNLMEKGD